jgi:hypothetical protein
MTKSDTTSSASAARTKRAAARAATTTASAIAAAGGLQHSPAAKSRNPSFASSTIDLTQQGSASTHPPKEDDGQGEMEE